MQASAHLFDAAAYLRLRPNHPTSKTSARLATRNLVRSWANGGGRNLEATMTATPHIARCIQAICDSGDTNMIAIAREIVTVIKEADHPEVVNRPGWHAFVSDLSAAAAL